MKSNEWKKASITAPLLQDVVDQIERDRVRRTQPVIENKPVDPARLDQDAGSGYNSDDTYPQQ